MKRPKLKTVLNDIKRSDGVKSVALRITYNRVPKYITLGIYCTPEQFDPPKFDGDSGRLKKSYPNFKSVNELLSVWHQKAKDILFEFERTGQMYSFAKFKAKFEGAADPNQKLVDYIAQREKHFLENGQHGNSTIYNSLGAMVGYFKPKATLSELDLSWVRKFEAFCRVERKMLDTSISIQLRTLRAVCNAAIKTDKLMPKEWYPFEDYSFAHLNTKTKKKAIKKREVDAFRNVEVSEADEFAHDLFLFSIFTRGMNLVDIANLKPASLRAGRIEYTRQKTKKQYSVALNEVSEAILKKYALAGGEYIFPIFSERHQTAQQKKDRKETVAKQVNNGIRKIAATLGIPTEDFTFYTGRHTYATILKKGGASTWKLKELMGHEKVSTTETYLSDFEFSEIDEADRLLF